MSFDALPLKSAASATASQIRVLRLVGDYGDGLQLAGKHAARQLSRHDPTPLTTARAGEDAFDIRFGAGAGYETAVDVLIALTPLALAGHLDAVHETSNVLLNTATSPEHQLPLGSVADSSTVDLDQVTLSAVGEMNLSHAEFVRCRNYAALGLACALLDQPIDGIRCRTANTSPVLVRAQRRVLQAGYALGERLAVEKAAQRPRALHAA